LDSNISTRTSKLASLVQAAAINRAKKEIDELEEEKKQQESLLKEVQSQITILQPQEADIQAEIANIIKLIKDTERDLRNIIRNLGTEKALIPNLETELTQLVENFEQNKKDAAEIKRQNK
jgi:chromosome segregation ATPase